MTTTPPPLPERTSPRSVRPALDPRTLGELQALRPAVRARVLRAYRRDAPTVMSVIERALEQADLAAVRDGAHRLKSSSAAIGASRLAGLYGTLESAARRGVLENERAVVTELRAELRRVLSVLSSIGEG